MFGHREGAWRIDPTVHPFASGGGVNDIRITTKYEQTGLESIFATIHEYGTRPLRAPDRSRARPDAARRRRLARHARVTEPDVGEPGRAQPAVLALLLPAAAGALPPQLGDVDEETWFRTVNRVQPSLIRIKADEITYNMHIILRFELEQDCSRATSIARPAARVEQPDGASTSASSRPTTPTGCSRTCTGGPGRSATSRPTRSAT